MPTVYIRIQKETIQYFRTLETSQCFAAVIFLLKVLQILKSETTTKVFKAMQIQKRKEKVIQSLS